MVEREEVDETPDETKGQESLDVDQLKKKLKAVQVKRQFKTKITVNLGNEEYNHGKSKITPDIFDGNDKTKNAQVFIENLNKTKRRH